MDEDDIYDPDEDQEVDWLYVEEDYSLADELAEQQIANPGYAGTNYALALEGFDYDVYNFWDDLDYGNDTYFDGPIDTVVTSTTASKNDGGDGGGIKRKREVRKQGKGSGDKRRRMQEERANTVVFVGMAERMRKLEKPAPALEEVKKGGKGSIWALLPDWREKFAGIDDTSAAGAVSAGKKRNAMPAEMRKAAARDEEDEDEEMGDRAPPRNHHSIKQAANKVEEELYDDDNDAYDEDEAEDEGGDEADTPLSIDPSALQAILRQRLGEAGLSGVDEGAFMRSISALLSGESGDADDATEELAGMLLGQASQGPSSGALAGWLAGQGVSIDQAGGDEEEEEEEEEAGRAGLAATNGGKRGAGSKTTTTTEQVSPPDSAVEVSKKHPQLSDSGPTSAEKAGVVSNRKRSAAASADPNDEQHSAVLSSPSKRHEPNVDNPGVGTKAQAQPQAKASRKRKADVDVNEGDGDDPKGAGSAAPAQKRRVERRATSEVQAAAPQPKRRGMREAKAKAKEKIGGS